MAIKDKPKKKKAGRGRPTKYSKDVCNRICDLIATTPKGLHSICRSDKKLPGFSTIFAWLKDESKKDFQDNYARAREAQGDLMAYKSIEIAAKPLVGVVIKETKDGTFREQSDNVSRSRLMYDANVFMASKLNPKKYGAKVDLTTDGDKLPQNTVVYIPENNRDAKT